MRVGARVVGVAVLTIVAAVLLALTSTMTSVYTLAAATYILPGFLGYPFTDQANIDLATPYITGTTGAQPPPPLSVLNYPATLPSPDTVTSGSVIFGYSQGALTATTFKQSFNQYWMDNAGVPPRITFVLIGNPDRPNGGGNERLNLGAATPTNTEGAASGQITTYDIARQYDGVSDIPTNPTNLLANLNSVMGFALVHTAYSNVDMSQAVLQATSGDTQYYLIPTYPLPLLMPLDVIPVAGPILADTLDPPLRVLVEAAYDRTINPGVPTPANSSYFPDPTTLDNNFLLAMQTGLDNAAQDLGLGRPLGTTRPDIGPGSTGQGAYGIGGPPVTMDSSTSQQQAATMAASIQSAPLVNSSDGSTNSSAPVQSTDIVQSAGITTGFNQKTIEPSGGSIGSKPDDSKPGHSNNGLLAGTVDALKSAQQPELSASGSTSTASANGGQGRHAR